MEKPVPQMVHWCIPEDTGSGSFWIEMYPDYLLQFYGASDPMNLTTEQFLPITVNPLTAKGRSAVVDGAVEFSSSDESIATIVSTGPLTAVVKPTGKPGVIEIRAKFDADLGPGLRTIERVQTLTIVNAEAASAEIEFGAPISELPGEPEPEPEPAPEPQPEPTPEPEPAPTPPPAPVDPWLIPMSLTKVPAGTTVPVLQIGSAKVNIKDFGALGNGAKDDTAAVAAAVKALPPEGGTVIVPAGTYMIKPTETSYLRSNMRLYFEEGAVFKAIPNADDRCYVILINNQKHVELYNVRVIGDRLQHNYVTFPPIVTTNPDGTTTSTPSSRDTHEWGHGVAVRGTSQYINVLNGNIRECTGDGMSCGGSDIFIYGTTFQFNRRQGLTLGSAKNPRVYNCDMLDTGAYQGNAGTNPMAGIDVEPDAPNDSRNVHIYGCRSLRNRVGYEFYCSGTLNVSGDYAEVTDFVIEESEAGFNILGVSFTGIKRGVVRNMFIHDNDATGLQTVARVDGLVLDNITYSRNYLRSDSTPPARNFTLAGTDTRTAKDILLKGTPLNVTYPTPSKFI